MTEISVSQVTSVILRGIIPQNHTFSMLKLTLFTPAKFQLCFFFSFFQEASLQYTERREMTGSSLSKTFAWLIFHSRVRNRRWILTGSGRSGFQKVDEAHFLTLAFFLSVVNQVCAAGVRTGPWEQSRRQHDGAAVADRHGHWSTRRAGRTKWSRNHFKGPTGGKPPEP